MVLYSNRAETCHQSEKDVKYSNMAKTCHQSEKDGTILKKFKNLSAVRKRWYNTQTVPKPVNSQKKMEQYSNRAKTCLQSEKDGSILSAKTCHESEKGDTILKQSQKLSPVRKRWYNTQTEPKPVTSQKKMIQYSNRSQTCHQSEKDGTILKQF